MFEYKVKTGSGKIEKGTVEADNFSDATEKIRQRGLRLISLKGIKVDTEEASKWRQVEVKIEKNPEIKNEESIIFSKKPTISAERKILSDDELDRVHNEIQELLTEKGARMSEETRNLLLHLDGKLDLVRVSQDKRKWKILKTQVRAAKKIAEREIKQYEEAEWRAYDEKNPNKHINSYSEFVINKPRRVFPVSNKFTRIFDSIKIIDQPNENNEKEVLLKQYYESAWVELQRFSGALLMFYLFFYFVSYYLKRIGSDDNFLVRIYDTILFKQIVIALFIFFIVLSLRQIAPYKRLKTDILWLVICIAAISAIFW